MLRGCMHFSLVNYAPGALHTVKSSGLIHHTGPDSQPSRQERTALNSCYLYNLYYTKDAPFNNLCPFHYTAMFVDEDEAGITDGPLFALLLFLLVQFEEDIFTTVGTSVGIYYRAIYKCCMTDHWIVASSNQRLFAHDILSLSST